MTSDEKARGDTEEQRERYRELLEELRTVIPGVQVLFAFLLTVPFSATFDELDTTGTQTFAFSLVAAGLAAVVLLTPAAYHRLAPQDDRAARLRLGVRVAIAGMVLLAAAIASSLFVVARHVFVINREPPADLVGPTTIAVGLAALVGGVAVVLWFALPVLRRRS